MKIRTDFVTNSSSSSYIISRKTVGEKATTKDILRMIDGFHRKAKPKKAHSLSVDIYDFNSSDVVKELGKENCVEILSWFFSDCLLDWYEDWQNYDWTTFNWDDIDYGWSQFTYDDFDLSEPGLPRFIPENVCKRCENGADCELRKYLGTNGYTIESALRFMGDFCIFHQHEIPSLATMKELHAVCSYFCDHMG